MKQKQRNAFALGCVQQVQERTEDFDLYLRRLILISSMENYWKESGQRYVCVRKGSYAPQGKELGAPGLWLHQRPKIGPQHESRRQLLPKLLESQSQTRPVESMPALPDPILKI